MVDLDAYFQQFLQNISLGEPQIPRMDSAAQAVSEFLVDSYGLQPGDVFLQGSYANGTAIEPVHDGEYDIDIVCNGVGSSVTADAALADLERRFRADGRYRNRVRLKKPCVRLEYAEDEVGKFHVDVVPVRRTETVTPPLDAPRRGDGWHGTAPAEYTAWCDRQGELYRRTVKAIKRWRDEQQTVRQAIKSIVLQVLVSQHMPATGGDADRLTATFTGMHDALSGLNSPPVIRNPVLPDENLAARWTVASFAGFKRELAEAVDWATKAGRSTDIVEAADCWRALLGDDFPMSSPGQLGYQLGSISHARPFTARRWTERLDSRYSVTVTADMLRSPRGKSHHLVNNGPLVFAGHKLHFRTQLRAPRHVDVYWQVANTGAHARDAQGLRGEIFKGRDLRKNPTPQGETWEDTSYSGAHVIRAVVVRANVVVAKSDWFQVNVYSPKRPYRP